MTRAATPVGWWRRHHDSATSVLAAMPAMLFLAVLYFLPMVLLFAVFQRYIMNADLSSGLKD